MTNLRYVSFYIVPYLCDCVRACACVGLLAQQIYLYIRIFVYIQSTLHCELINSIALNIDYSLRHDWCSVTISLVRQS